MCYHAALRYSSVSTIMKFPGKRKSKHYFPVNARDPLLQQIQPEQETNASWVVGIDQRWWILRRKWMTILLHAMD